MEKIDLKIPKLFLDYLKDAAERANYDSPESFINARLFISRQCKKFISDDWFKRAHAKKPGDVFTVPDLYTEKEWEEFFHSFRRILGKTVRRRAERQGLEPLGVGKHGDYEYKKH
jgi:hypothetical protein